MTLGKISSIIIRCLNKQEEPGYLDGLLKICTGKFNLHKIYKLTVGSVIVKVLSIVFKFAIAPIGIAIL